MTVFAIGDLHLGHAVEKPMDVFGIAWSNHTQRIEEYWRSKVSESDTVLIPGDVSWAMTLEEALPDLNWIGGLPGDKVMIRGNHDYWWSGIGKVRNALPAGLRAIQNDSVVANEYAICGTRGWLLPTHPNFTEDDERMVQRELHRLELSLQSATQAKRPIICMIHYPPIGPDGESTAFSDLIDDFPVKYCLYGHLHGAAHRFAANLTHHGVTYQLVSADYLDFSPLELP